jgi:predicted transposase/invertase (TIGR01784 family)
MYNNNDNGRFISILSDYGFKVTFGNESDTTFLKKALQALIESPVPIISIEFVKNEMSALTFDSRSGIYDLACMDEKGNYFIVEMQLSQYPEFIHRMKFYGLHRFNTLIKKGDYKFENLPKIYCIGVLAIDIFPHINDYHNIGVLKNDKNEIIDDQMTFIMVELTKFTKQLPDIQTDLDKLIFTMKALHSTTPPIQYPQFWDEEWLKIAIQELDTRAMTSEQRLQFEMTLSANALAVKNEQKKIAKGILEAKIESITKSLKRGKLTIEEIAEDNSVDVDFVIDIQQKNG